MSAESSSVAVAYLQLLEGADAALVDVIEETIGQDDLIEMDGEPAPRWSATLRGLTGAVSGWERQWKQAIFDSSTQFRVKHPASGDLAARAIACVRSVADAFADTDNEMLTKRRLRTASDQLGQAVGDVRQLIEAGGAVEQPPPQAPSSELIGQVAERAAAKVARTFGGCDNGKEKPPPLPVMLYAEWQASASKLGCPEPARRSAWGIMAWLLREVILRCEIGQPPSLSDPRAKLLYELGTSHAASPPAGAVSLDLGGNRDLWQTFQNDLQPSMADLSAGNDVDTAKLRRALSYILVPLTQAVGGALAECGVEMPIAPRAPKPLNGVEVWSIAKAAAAVPMRSDVLLKRLKDRGVVVSGAKRTYSANPTAILNAIDAKKRKQVKRAMGNDE